MDIGVMDLLIGRKQVKMEERYRILFRMESYVFGIGVCSLNGLCN